MRVAKDQLYHDADLVRFYDPENGWGPDLDYCARLAEDAASVLDLGCGTGVFLAALPAAKRRAGVDPAAAMLAIARDRPGGDRVTWIEGDARDLTLDARFDLVTLTGHAFQVFLTPEDQRAVLDTIAAHLNPGGRFIFDTRNPAAEEWRDWTPARSRRRFDHPDLGQVDAWNDVAHDPDTGVVTYETHYQVRADGRHDMAASRVVFPDRRAVADLLAAAGLRADTWLGDWHGAPMTETSPEIIPIGGPARSERL